MNGLIAYLRKSQPMPVSSDQIREMSQPYLTGGGLSADRAIYDCQTNDHKTEDKGLSD